MTNNFYYMTSALHDGLKTSREAWPLGKWVYLNFGHGGGHLWLRNEDDSRQPWVPTWRDLRSSDWVVVPAAFAAEAEAKVLS